MILYFLLRTIPASNGHLWEAQLYRMEGSDATWIRGAYGNTPSEALGKLRIESIMDTVVMEAMDDGLIPENGEDDAENTGI